jgi:nitroreductase
LVEMNVEEAIKGRRSIRKYLDKPVPVGSIRRIIEAGTYAPSGKNGQPWRFTVLTGRSKDEVTDLMRSGLEGLEGRHGARMLGSSFNSCRIMREAPVLLLVWNSGESFDSPRLSGMMDAIREAMPRVDDLAHTVEIQGVSAAIQNMLLMAHGMGLGSLWINDIYYVLDSLKDHFGHPWELVAAVSLGYPAESERDKEPPSKLSVDEVAEFR